MGRGMSELSVKSTVQAVDCSCTACMAQTPRPVAYCPNCGLSQRKPAASPNADLESPVAETVTDDNVIRAVFGKPNEPDTTDKACEPAEPPAPEEEAKCSPDLMQTEQSASSELQDTPQSGAAAELPPVTDKPCDTETQQQSGSKSKSKHKWLIAAAAVVGLILLLRSIPSSQPAAGTDAASPITVYVTRDDAAVRDQPKATGSQLVTNLARGTSLTGTWQSGPLSSKWLKIVGSQYQGDYVWERNVSANALPNVVQKVDGYLTTTQRAELRDSPTPGGNVVATARAGVRLYIAYAVDGGWYEVPLRRGGVGYVQPSAFQ